MIADRKAEATEHVIDLIWLARKMKPAMKQRAGEFDCPRRPAHLQNPTNPEGHVYYGNYWLFTEELN